MENKTEHEDAHSFEGKNEGVPHFDVWSQCHFPVFFSWEFVVTIF